ncbi:MAG: ABC transporter permease [Promethearchaeota archaeon]|nr:MAG: ABC transporter permease [Candidatus Lokiarchaeota archaeon]
MNEQREEGIGVIPILDTVVFEMKKQKKKFYFFLGVAILVVILIGYLLQLIPENLLPDTQAGFYSSGLGFISFITLFAACLFFSGIICTEFNKRTGFIVFPKINKYKLIIGKYLGNLILVVSIITVYYFILAILGFYYYGGPINIRLFYSYGFAVLYVIALSSFVTLFSSFMKSETVTIIITLIILLIGLNIADQIITLVFRDAFEPLYSLSYLGNIITSILEFPFPDPRYSEFSFSGMGPFGGGSFIIGTWLTPSIEMAIILLLLYIIACFLLAALLFKRRQL